MDSFSHNASASVTTDVPKKEDAPTSGVQASPSQDAKAKVDAEHFKSKGYRLHNEATYRGVDWLANSAVGVSTSLLVDRTKFGKNHIAKFLNAPAGWVIKHFTQDANTIREGAKWGTRLGSIMAGGFAIIPVMMALENKDNKKHIIRWMDEKIYGKETVANDPKFQQSYDRISEEPKKGFAKGLVARFIALAPIFVIAFTPKYNDRFTEHLYDPIARRTQWLFTKLRIPKVPTPAAVRESESILQEGALNYDFKKPYSKDQVFPPTDKLSNNDFMHRMIGFDFGLTIFYALMHEAAYKTLSAMGMRGHKTETATPDMPASIQAVPASSAGMQSSDSSWADRAGPKGRNEKQESHVAAVDSSRHAGQQLAL